MSVDSPVLLVEDILEHLRPWTTILDYAFYIGAAYGAIKCMQLTKEVISGFRAYFLSNNAIFGPKDFREQYGKWAGVLDTVRCTWVHYMWLHLLLYSCHWSYISNWSCICIRSKAKEIYTNYIYSNNCNSK